jgi:hypothetical protein
MQKRDMQLIDVFKGLIKTLYPVIEAIRITPYTEIFRKISSWVHFPTLNLSQHIMGNFSYLLNIVWMYIRTLGLSYSSQNLLCTIIEAGPSGFEPETAGYLHNDKSPVLYLAELRAQEIT